jgi:hypothetical protein
MAQSAVGTAIGSPQASNQSRDRAFYTGIAVAMLITVLAGFARTYFLRPWFMTAPLPWLLHVHGALFTAWILLFVAQTALIATHRIRVHRRLGYAGAVLAGCMVVIGVAAAIHRAAQGSAPPGFDPRAFLTIPLGDMALFAPLIALAIWLRRNKESHKRLIVLASVALMPAPIARIIRPLHLGPLGFFGCTDLFIVAGILYDFASRRRVHPASIWGGLAIVASQPLRLLIAGTDTWLRVADFLIR